MIVYQTSPTDTEGGIEKVTVSDKDTQNLLFDILKEMKKANLHNAIINDVVINDTEVEI